MQHADDPRHGRRERKYVLSDEMAVAVRDALGGYLQRDPHMPAHSVRGYAVHSLYFDTPTLELYRLTREGVRQRYKLRVRFYDEDAAGPAFVEVKEKNNGLVHKWRYPTDKRLAADLLSDQSRTELDAALSNGGASTALGEFCRRRDALQAAPKLLISYEREAFNAKNGAPVRVTFDRRIKTNLFARQGGLDVAPYGVSVGGLNVVLELKYTGDPPDWIMRIETDLAGSRKSFSKFARSVDALGISGRPRRNAVPKNLR